MSKVVDEFNTNIADGGERKRLRKKRIDKKNTVDTVNNEEVQEVKNGSSRTGGQQVSDSLLHLDNKKHEGLKEVTSVRVKTDDAESKRRIEDEELRRDRLGKLQHEALASAKANATIELKWSELLDQDIPQQLHYQIEEQVKSCSSIISSKDALIKEFQRQLRAKDEEYVRTLRQESEDIDNLLATIRKEFKELQTEYEYELNEIEEAYIEERERLIGEHAQDIEQMFDTRRTKETFYRESKQKREEQFQRDLEDLIIKGADQSNKLKIDLEKNIQTLKQQLEEIRATYQLNTEKLDYNFRVLTEYDIEKNAEVNRYKRKLNKLKDAKNKKQEEYKALYEEDAKNNAELTEDYRSLTQKYKDLQAKFRHFEIADTGKYDEVWSMHEEEVKDLIDQLLKADKIITEQQLGWFWKAPDPQSLQSCLGRQGMLAISLNAEPSTSSSPGGGGEGSPGQKSVEGSGNSVDGEPGPIGDADESILGGSVHSGGALAKVAGVRVRAMLRMLASEGGFLTDPDIQKSLDSLVGHEAELAKAEAMLKALGVKSETKLRALVNFFFRETTAGNTVPYDQEGYLADEEDPDAEEINFSLHFPGDDLPELRTMIKAEDMIKAVKAFMENEKVQLGFTGGGGSSSTSQKQEDAKIGQRRLQIIRDYWHRLSQIVNDDTVQVWRQLGKESKNLHELLTIRASSIEEVDGLNNRNMELKRLLNQYLGDGSINDNLMVPPAQVMRVRHLPSVSSMPNNNSRLSQTSQPQPSFGVGGGALNGGGSKSTVLQPGGGGAGNPSRMKAGGAGGGGGGKLIKKSTNTPQQPLMSKTS